MMRCDWDKKPVRRVVGLMSGTSVDGIDAALVELSGDPAQPSVRLVAFENRPFLPAVRDLIFQVFQPREATVDRVGYLNVLLGELYAQAVLSVAQKAGLAPGEIDLVGSHGQTIWHAPEPRCDHGFPIRYTVQIGEGAVIANRTGIPTISDFRVADMALGGQGAPLVPFTEYLLYRVPGKTRLLQNIGGVGNITVLPAQGGPEGVFAFDTGPGNMMIDAVVSALTGGREAYDAGGRLAASGRVDEALLARLQADEYYALPLPKTTGRERFGAQYTARLMADPAARDLTGADLAATVTHLTAWSIADAYRRYILPRCRADELVVGGGGSYNPTLMGALAREMAAYDVPVRTQEDLGFSSDAKEAVAFALLADRAACGMANTLPSVTGAAGPAVMGKLSLPCREVVL